jgi:hypothetical protein
MRRWRLETRPKPGPSERPSTFLPCHSADDVRELGWAPDGTIFSYAIRDDREEPIGQVNVTNAAALIRHGYDVPEWIATKLTKLERSIGPDDTRHALRVVLGL